MKPPARVILFGLKCLLVLPLAVLGGLSDGIDRWLNHVKLEWRRL